MPWWIEFKTTLLPWILAAAVVALIIAEAHRTTAQLVAVNESLTQVLQEQGRVLDRLQQTLSVQGYTVSPFAEGAEKLP